MKQYGFIYNGFEKMKSFIYSNNIDKNDNLLIQIFTGVVEVGFIEDLLVEILSILPNAEIIGATTAGEIFNEKVLTNSTVISFTTFETIKIKSTLLKNDNNNEYKLGIDIVEKLVEEDTKAVILLSDGLLTSGWDVIKGIQSINSKITICGGRAGDNGYLSETFVFTKDGITKSGLAAASLTGEKLNITTECSFGWSPIGKLMTITEVSNNRIYTIDNIKAIDIYRKYLGEEVANGLPMSATEFPFIVKKNGLELAKVISACNDDGSLSFFGDLEVNDKVQFGYGNVNMLLDQSLEIANKMKNRNMEAIFVYSCSSRKSFMQDKVRLEIEPLNKIAPTFGFFTYGEFFTGSSAQGLLNITMTILGISEGENKPIYSKIVLTKNHSPSKSIFDGKDLGVVKALTHLVNEATKELQQANEMLEEQKYRIQQINNITKSILQVNSEIISSGEVDKVLQMILDKIMDIIPKGKMASILMVENNRLCYKATKGYLSEKIKEVKYKLCNVSPYSRKCTEELFNPVIIKDLERNLFFQVDEYNFWKKQLAMTPYESLSCGIGINDEVIGFVNIFNTNAEESFNEDDKSLLKYICYDIAIALKNLKLLENVLYMSRYDSLTGYTIEITLWKY